jgi:hypothetical protein
VSLNHLFGIIFPIILVSGAISHELPDIGNNKVAYYAFDATPVDQGALSLVNFTDNANIIVVFEGTLWELADTIHYNTGAMRNRVYTSKKKILDDIQTLRKRGIFVLMNVDDAASWSTSTPFTTWNKKTLDFRQFAAFIDSCVTAAGFDGISLDVEHKAVDNTDYRNLIKELGRYFGPFSSSAGSKIYTGAFYTSQFTTPGKIFRDTSLGRYMNFVMDMGYEHDNTERFKFWATTLGNSRVMNGMSHQYNDLKSAVAWAAWHPTPEKAGVMVFAGNVNKRYTDTVFAALGGASHSITAAIKNSDQLQHVHITKQSFTCELSLRSPGIVSLRIFSMNGRVCTTIFESHYKAGTHIIHGLHGRNTFSPGVYHAVLDVNDFRETFRLILH